jgi:hypothetical protein
MKTCFRCKVSKPLDQFNRSAKNRDGRHSYCRDCQKAHYRGNYERHYRNVRRVALARLARHRRIIYDALRGGCIDCGFTDIRALQFDHVRGEKLGSISQMVRQGTSDALLRAEIAKCDVRCANCHMIVTVNRRAADWHNDYL